jgi:hypothetical protein
MHEQFDEEMCERQEREARERRDREREEDPEFEALLKEWFAGDEDAIYDNEDAEVGVLDGDDLGDIFVDKPETEDWNQMDA